MSGATTRSRLASKSQENYTMCFKSVGKNWLMCEGCKNWTHSSWMGYSHDIFKFLARTANVEFLCNGCLSADFRPKSTVDVGELSKRLEDIKESLEIIKSRPTCNLFPRQLEAKFCSVVKSSSDISQELRFNEMSKISMGTESKIEKSNILSTMKKW